MKKLKKKRQLKEKHLLEKMDSNLKMQNILK